MAVLKLMGTERPLAIAPMGTGNVVALRLSIPLQIERMVRRDGGSFARDRLRNPTEETGQQAVVR